MRSERNAVCFLPRHKLKHEKTPWKYFLEAPSRSTGPGRRRSSDKRSNWTFIRLIHAMWNYLPTEQCFLSQNQYGRKQYRFWEHFFRDKFQENFFFRQRACFKIFFFFSISSHNNISSGSMCVQHAPIFLRYFSGINGSNFYYNF